MTGISPLLRSETDLAQYINVDLAAPQNAYPGERIDITAGLSLDGDISDRASLDMFLRAEERKRWKGHIDVMLAYNIGTLEDFPCEEDVFEFTESHLEHHHFRFSDAHALFEENGVYRFKFDIVTPYKAGNLDYDIIGVRARLRDKPTYDGSTWEGCPERFIEMSSKMQPVVRTVPLDDFLGSRESA